MSKSKQKKKLKRQFMGKVDSVGFKLVKIRDNRFNTYAMIEVRLDRVKTFEEAEEKVQALKKSLFKRNKGVDVVLFAP